MARVAVKPDARAAAVDTLCHIVQQSEAKLAAGAASPATLGKLLAMLEPLAGEPRFRRELDFLRAKFAPLAAAGGGGGAPGSGGGGGPPVPLPLPAPAPAGAGASVPSGAKLCVGASLPLAGGAVFATAYDAGSQQTVAAGTGAPMTVWGPGGNVVAQ